MDVREFFKTAVGRAVERALYLAVAAFVVALMGDVDQGTAAGAFAYFLLKTFADYINPRIPNVVK